jgi:hypothetical protein
MTATSPVSTAQLRMRISRHLKNHGERLVQSPDGRWCVVNAHDGLVVRGQHLWWSLTERPRRRIPAERRALVVETPARA